MRFFPFELLYDKKEIPLFSQTLELLLKNTDSKIQDDRIILNTSIGKFEIAHYWDIIYAIKYLIDIYHIKNKLKPIEKLPKNIILFGKKENVYIEDNVKIQGQTIIHAYSPVIISNNVVLKNFNVIESPVYIGKNTLIDNATLRGPVIIGKTCKLSGEIEESFIMDFVNKHHYGFLGHAIIENWVNLGAGTTNSDLKNNYSNIRMFNGEQFIDTGYIKMGCIIGEHSKTAIGTMINTGTVIGPFCNVFGDIKRIKYMPAFSWGNKNYKFELDKLIQLIKTVSKRRDIVPSETYLKKIKILYEKLS